MSQAILDIQVRVAAQQARAALKSLNTDLRAMQGAAGGVGSAMGRALNPQHLERFGKNLQWTGRQLEFNFTLPLLLAGGAATKWSLENERASTRVRKVYGDLSYSTERVNSETKALDRTFRLLSDRFGVAQKDVIEIGAAWAQAGAAGVGLARATRLTMETMVLGEMEAAEATQGLIAIQSAYRLNTIQLKQAVADLNIIENQTSISFQGLIDVLVRAGGVARSAGIDIRHLAAMASVLVPAAGSAAQAGNSLRTVISRLMAPTKDSADVLKLMGINIFEASWQAKTGMERIEALAKAFDNLSEAQKTAVSSTVASRWQVNRFNILMEDLARFLADSTDKASSYGKALAATADPTRTAQVYANELTTVLASAPQAFAIMTRQIQNSMAQAIIPLLPALLAIMTRVAGVVRAFSELNPVYQQWIIFGLAALALIGPITKYVGAFATLLGVLGSAIGIATGAAMSLRAGLMGVGAASLFVNGELPLTRHLAFTMGTAFRRAGDAIMWMIKMPWRAYAAAMDFLFAAGVTSVNLFLRAMIFASQATVAAVAAMPRAVSTAVSAMVHLWGAGQVAMARFAVWVQTAIPAAMTAAQTAILRFTVWISTALPAAVTVAQTAFLRFTVWITTALPAAMMAARLAMLRLAVFMTTVLPAAVAAAQAAFMRFSVFMSTVVPVAMMAARRAIVQLAFFMIMGLPRMMAMAGAALARVFTGIAALPMLLARGWAMVLPLLIRIGPMLLRAIPYVAIISAVAAVAWALRDHFAKAIKNVQESFNDLPPSVARVFTSVARVIRTAVEKIREWLSYLNPFARHSPSLVDQVTAGVSTILSQYKRLSGIIPAIRGAKNALMEFLAATTSAREAQNAQEFGEQRAEIVAIAPNAGPAVDNLRNQIKALQLALFPLAEQITDQQASVDKWAEALRKAGLAIEAARLRLDRLKVAADALQDRLDAAQKRLDILAKTPIAGMGAMADAIFENEMAQKRLRLEILRLEQAGESVDDLRDRYAKLSGEIETLRGDREELRLAGAGSDVLATYDAQISALEEQRRMIANTSSPIQQMEDQLEQLRRAGEILDLENSLKFDPLTRQIDQMINGMKEMPFDELVTGIKSAQAEVADLTTKWEAADLAVRQQEMAIGLLEEAERRIQATHDAEKAKLDQLETAYSDVENSIRAMEQAYSDMASAAASAAAAREAAANDLSIAEQTFLAGEGADFEIPGGDSGIMPEGGLAEIEAFNAELEKELAELSKTMGGFDMFQPFKDMWNKGWEWLKNNPLGRVAGSAIAGAGIGMIFGPWGALIGAAIGALAGLMGPQIASAFGDAFSGAGETLSNSWDEMWQFMKDSPVGGAIQNLLDIVEMVVSGIMAAWNWFKDDIISLWDIIWSWLVDLGTKLWAELGEWAELFDPFMEAMTHVYNVATTILKALATAITVIVAGILAAWKLAWPVLEAVLRPILEVITTLVMSALKIIRGIIQTVLALINGDWGQAWAGIKNILAGVWDAIYGILRGAVSVVWGILVAVFGEDGTLHRLFKGIVSILKSVWHGIQDAMAGPVNWVIRNVINKLIDAINWVADKIPGIDINIGHVGEIGSSGGAGGGGGGARAPMMLRTGGVVPGHGQGDRVPAMLEPGEGVIPKLAMSKIDRDTFEMLRRGETDTLARKPETGGPFDWVPSPSDVWEGIKDAGEWTVDQLRKGVAYALETMIDPTLVVLDTIVDKFPGPFSEVIKGSIHHIADGVIAWVKGVDDQAKKAQDQMLTVGTGTHTGVGESAKGPLIDYMKRTGVPFRATSTLRPGAMTATGNVSMHSRGLAVDFAGPRSSVDSPELLAINEALYKIKSKLYELIYSGPGAKEVYRGADHNFSGVTHQMHHDHVHASIFAQGGGQARYLAAGGIVTRATGAVIGERGPEAVLPLKEFWEKLDYGFNSVVRAINMFDFNDATRTTRVETRIMEGLTKIDVGIKPAIMEGATLVAGTVTTGLQATAQSINESVGAGLTSLSETFQAKMDALSQRIEQVAAQGSPGTGVGTGGGSSGYVPNPSRGIPGRPTYGPGVFGGFGWRSIPGMASGGLVKARPGGTLVLVGEGGQDEIIAPVGSSSGTVERHVHIHGDLVFPNIRSGDDAEALIRNLEAMSD